jgi:polyhydroxybutyrate depolymerase
MTRRFGPGGHHVTLDVGGVRREYWVRVPPRGREPRPVVMLLHGTGGTATWAAEEARFDTFADRHGVVAVYPQALPPDPDAPLKFLANPAAWNASGMTLPGHTPDDVAYFAALLDDLPRRTAIDPRRVYVTGFSNGAAMTFELAAACGDRIAAIAPVAGYCRVTRVERPMPTLFVLGADDPMVPLEGGTFHSPWTKEVKRRAPVWEGLDRWARLIGCEPRRESVFEHGGVRVERYPGPAAFEVVIVDGLGHHWPGGLGRLKRSLAGEPSNRLDGNAVIWEFFRRRRSR